MQEKSKSYEKETIAGLTIEIFDKETERPFAKITKLSTGRSYDLALNMVDDLNVSFVVETIYSILIELNAINSSNQEDNISSFLFSTGTKHSANFITRIVLAKYAAGLIGIGMSSRDFDYLKYCEMERQRSK
jgi:hypothetical protein